jgi:hypothetical protein
MVSQLFHTNIPIAKILMTPIQDSDGVIHRSGVDDRGLYIVSEVRNDIKISDEVWDKIVKREIRGFSIGGEYLSKPTTECVNGKCHKRVDDIELHEVSIVANPANKVALFTVLKDDSLSKLAELTNKISDKLISEGVIQVSKRPYSDGKYGIWVHTSLPILDEHVAKNMSLDGFKVVKEKCPYNEWISLFDLALLRPYSIREEVLTGGIPVDSKDASLLDKSESVGEPTLSIEVKEEKKENVATPVECVEANTDVVPPQVEKQPLTLEIIAADLAKMLERLNGIEAKFNEYSKAEYPWDQCISDRLADGYSQEQADKICGAIRSGTVQRKGTETKVDWDAWLTEFEKNENKMIKSVDPPKPVEAPKPTVNLQPEVNTSVSIQNQLENTNTINVPIQEVKQVEQPKTPEPVVETPKVVVRGVVPPPKREEDTSSLLERLYKTPWSKLREMS